MNILKSCSALTRQEATHFAVSVHHLLVNILREINDFCTNIRNGSQGNNTSKTYHTYVISKWQNEVRHGFYSLYEELYSQTSQTEVMISYSVQGEHFNGRK
jgi:hypothetical protein